MAEHEGKAALRRMVERSRQVKHHEFARTRMTCSDVQQIAAYVAELEAQVSRLTNKDKPATTRTPEEWSDYLKKHGIAAVVHAAFVDGYEHAAAGKSLD